MNVLARHSKIDSPVTPTLVETPPPPRPVEQPPPAASTASAARAYAGPSVISSALVVIGRLESGGDIQIDGKVEGDVKGQAVRIGAGATIKGTVFGEVVELAGTIEGKIEAKAAVLTKSARMTGDIQHQSLKIDEGAYFNGNSRPHSGPGPMRNNSGPSRD